MRVMVNLISVFVHLLNGEMDELSSVWCILSKQRSCLSHKWSLMIQLGGASVTSAPLLVVVGSVCSDVECLLV